MTFPSQTHVPSVQPSTNVKKTKIYMHNRKWQTQLEGWETNQQRGIMPDIKSDYATDGYAL